MHINSSEGKDIQDHWHKVTFIQNILMINLLESTPNISHVNNNMSVFKNLKGMCNNIRITNYSGNVQGRENIGI